MKIIFNSFLIHYCFKNFIGKLFVLLTISLLLINSCFKNVLPEKISIPSETITILGTKVNYLVQGEGVPIILVHGVPTSSFLYRKMIPILSEKYKVYAIDLPGYGLSEAPKNQDYSITNYERYLTEFIDTIGIQQPILLGHDYGGPIVLLYLLNHSQSYSKLVLLNTIAFPDYKFPFLFKIMLLPPIGEVVLGLFGDYIFKTSMKMGVYNKKIITDNIVESYLNKYGNPKQLGKSILKTGRTASRYLRDNLAYIDLSEIDKPTLIIWGKEDVYIPYSEAEHIHNSIHGSILKSISNCGHFLQEEKPEIVSNYIIEFLSKD